MFAVRWSAPLLGRCSPRLLPSCSTTPLTPRTVLRAPHRYATTAAKPRAKKTQIPPGDEVVTVPKKPLSTKTPAAPSPKTPRRKKADIAETSAEAATLAPKKSTRASSTKSPAAAAAAAAKKKSETGAESTADTTSTPRPKAGQGSANTVPSKEQVSSGQSAGANAPSSSRRPADVHSPEYKAASRKWTSLMVGLPLLIVSSYFLYDRLILGNAPKSLGTSPPPSPAEPRESEA